LRVAAVGDFGALHCQTAQKFDKSTQLQFCTSPPIVAKRLLPAGVFIPSVYKPLSLLRIAVIVFVESGCAFAYFLFFEGQEILKNNFPCAACKCVFFCELAFNVFTFVMLQMLFGYHWLPLCKNGQTPHRIWLRK
jgi:hypothetical protein